MLNLTIIYNLEIKGQYKKFVTIFVYSGSRILNPSIMVVELSITLEIIRYTRKFTHIELLASSLLMLVILIVVYTNGLKGFSGIVIGGIVGLDIYFFCAYFWSLNESIGLLRGSYLSR